jgi:GAF domain-containing protein
MDMPTNPKRIPLWLTGWKFPWAAGAGLYILVYASWLLFKWTNPAYEPLIANLAYLPLGVFAAFSALSTARHTQISPSLRRAWQLIALSMLSLVTGDILYTLINLTRNIRFPDLPDLFYLAFYPLAFSGLLAIPAAQEDPDTKRTRILDLIITISSATGILWYFIIAPTATAGGETWLAKWVAGAYPLLDALLIASTLSLLLQPHHPAIRQPVLFLAIGISLYTLADLIYAWMVLQNTYTSGNFIDILWTSGYYLIGLAALRQTDPSLAPLSRTPASPTLWQSVILSITALSASIILSFYVVLTKRELNDPAIGLLIATFITITLTIARLLLTTANNARLVQQLSATTHQLQTAAETLQTEVKERTQELQNQTNKLYLVSQAARDIAAASSLENILQLASTSLPATLQIHHLGIYLLDTNREFAALLSASSPEGKQMLADGYKLNLQETSLLAQAATKGEPAAASIADPLPAPPNRPLLPDTRSALALPIKAANRTIGILDLQSPQPQAFQRAEDITILQIIADQIGIAIERARLLEQVEENLKQLQRAYGETTRERWRTFAEMTLTGNAGYRFDNVRLQPLQSMPEAGQEAIRRGVPFIQKPHATNSSQPLQVAVPIKLRGQPIGVVNLKLKTTHNPNTIKTITLAVERLASALESARLFEEARLKAEREQTISQVTAAITAASEFETILRATVEEIGKSLGDAEVSIQLAETLE